VFRTQKGVAKTQVGYSGGHSKNPSYEDVCSGSTGHAEAVQVDYDPSQISYSTLLEVFWKCHNPTTLNRQGPDVGTQYRSTIFFHTPEQEETAKRSKETLARSGRYKNEIVTEIKPLSTFYPAEEYHQQYLSKRGLSNCHL